MPAASPTTLITPDLASGQALARLLASQLPPASADAGSMEANLRTANGRGIDPDLATAIYFHAIALANQGWKQAPGR